MLLIVLLPLEEEAEEEEKEEEEDREGRVGVEQAEGEEPKEAGEGGRSSPPHICIEPCSACNFYLVLTHLIALVRCLSSSLTRCVEMTTEKVKRNCLNFQISSPS